MRTLILASILIAGFSPLSVSIEASPFSSLQAGRTLVPGGLDNWKKETLEGVPTFPGSLTLDGENLVFECPPNRETAWTQTTVPIWIECFPRLRIRFHAIEGEGIVSLLLSDDSTGPITPGALNPENPLASGGQGKVDLDLTTREAWFDLGKTYPSDRIARVTLVLHAGDSPLRIEIEEMSFWESDLDSSGLGAAVQASAMGSKGETPCGQWTCLPLPDIDPASIPGSSNEEIWVSKIPFRTPQDMAVVPRTGFEQREDLALSGLWNGSEMALLLHIDRCGNDQPWYSKDSLSRLAPLDSPHQLAVEIEYEGGWVQTQFPWSPTTGDFVLNEGQIVALVSLDPARRITEIRLQDKMESGRILLLAASLNTDASNCLHPGFGEIAMIQAADEKIPVASPTRATLMRTGDQLTLENRDLRMIADLSSGFLLREMVLLPSDRRILSHSEDVPFFTIQDSSGAWTGWSLVGYREESLSDGMMALLTWRSDQEERPGLEFQLGVAIRNEGEIQWIPTLKNLGNVPLHLDFSLPRLASVTIGAASTNSHYLLGTRNTLMGKQDVEIQQPYGGSYPLQFLDLFDPEAGGGLALLVQDSELAPKTFCFRHEQGQASISVDYSHLVLEPSNQTTLPISVFDPHGGDWHESLDSYRGWVRKEFPRPHPAGLTDLFYCRRDYPLGGTGYLFDPHQIKYTPDRLIEESKAAFGDFDFIDISGWAYNEGTGRVGDYLTNDLGGLEELKRCVDRAHGEGVRVGLYFEGYLLDKRSEMAKKALPAWQVVAENGAPRWWNGEMEFFTCPGVSEWRQAYAEMVTEVAKRSGADAVYVDQFGFAGPDKACWSKNHGHPVPSNPLVEEKKMLEGIRAALSRESLDTSIYTEQVPCDAIAPWVDAAFNYGMRTHHPHPCEHPTKLPLHRFVFPEIAVVEMIGHGIRPIPVDEEDLHLCFFHGLAVWLKGRASSWFTPDFQDTAQLFAPVLSEYSEVFRSADCTPLIPTLKKGLYANRFSSEGRTILTLYNSNPIDLEGNLLRVSGDQPQKVVNLLDPIEVAFQKTPDGILLGGRVPPHETVAFLIVH